MFIKNNKQIGEIGERIAIGELSKYGLDILLPMSDNLPFDFVVIKDGIFYKCQVKTTNIINKNNSLRFSLTSNNWYKKIEYQYNSDDVDVIICCDMNTIYLFKYIEVCNKKNIYLKLDETKNGQMRNVNFAKDYIINENKVNEIFK